MEALTIAQVLKVLRPYLPKGYVRDMDVYGSVGYRYPDKLLILIYGVCRWNASAEEKEACQALSIRIVPSDINRRSRRCPKGLRTSINRLRKDGSFNLLAIGSRIQTYLAQIEAMEAERLKQKVQREADAEAQKGLTNEVRDLLEHEGFSPALLERYTITPLFARKIQPNETEDEAGEDEELVTKGPRGGLRVYSDSIDFDLHGLTFDQVQRVLRALKPVQVKSKPCRSKRMNFGRAPKGS